MSESLSGWIYIDPVKVWETEHRIKISEGVFEYGILDEEQSHAYWAYDRGTGIPIVSNKELEEDAYNAIDDKMLTSTGNPEKTEAQLTVPIEFFPPEDDDDLNKIASKVDKSAFIREKERRHFVFNADLDMHKGDTRSVYLLTDDQVTDRLSGPDDWGDSFGSKPQFFS